MSEQLKEMVETIFKHLKESTGKECGEAAAVMQRHCHEFDKSEMTCCAKSDDQYKDIVVDLEKNGFSNIKDNLWMKGRCHVRCEVDADGIHHFEIINK